MNRTACFAAALGALWIPALLCAQALDDVDEGHGPVDAAQAAARIIEDTNAFRRENGLAPLERNDALGAAAQTFAEYMAATGRYGHTADGKQPAERIMEHGYDYCSIAENIAYTYQSSGYGQRELSRALVQGWIDSPPHRENMLDPALTEIGVGVARSAETGYYYGVQDFGRPKSATIKFSIANESTERVTYSLADERFTLQPHYTRMHRLCREPTVAFSLPGRRSRSQTTTFTAKSGDHFTVRGTKGSIAITQR
jgi:uncharacterized protein YkwD